MKSRWYKSKIFLKRSERCISFRPTNYLIVGFLPIARIRKIVFSTMNQLRLYLIISAFLFFFSALTVYSQDSLGTDKQETSLPQFLFKDMSIELNNVPLKMALAEFSSVSGIYLNYNENIIPSDIFISLKSQNVPAIDILRKILSGTNITFILTDTHHIVLTLSNNKNTTDLRKNYTISGFIIDAATGEALNGANIYIENLWIGCVSNDYGFYSLTLPHGLYLIVYNYMGYEVKTEEIYLFKNIRKDVELIPNILSGETIVVTADADEDITQSTEIGAIKLSPKDLSNIPILLGEQDILKTLHLLPGVTLSNEGESGFHVRGGNADQNLVLLDEAPVYNAFHLFGFFSVFNSDAIKNIKLIKGSAPPKYGGSLSSVLDIQMKEGNYKEFKGNGGIGSIFSRLTIEGPLVKDKSSYILSARRTYADAFIGLFAEEEIKKSSLYFYDFNLKTNYRLSHNDRIYLSGYLGRDVLGVTDIFRNTWGNKTVTLRWNHIFNEKLFLNSSLIFSSFDYMVHVEPEEDSPEDGIVEVGNEINASTFKQDLQYFLNSRNTINFGWQYIYYNFLPGKFSGGGDSAFNLFIGKRTAQDAAVYLAHEWDITNQLTVDYGLRYSLFFVDRMADSYYFSDIEGVPYIDFRGTESIIYKKAEPRLSVKYNLSESSAIKLGFARNFQNIHLLSNSTPGTPFNIWQPSSSRVKPQKSDQISCGYFQNMSRNTAEFTVEIFYKKMRNQVDFTDGANIFLSTLFESDLAFGAGESYGIEFLLKKNAGKLTGWIGYSLAKTIRRFDDINDGIPFPPKFDRTHDFSVVAIYRIDKKWTLAANWVLYTGNALTIPFAKYQLEGRTFHAYTPRNGFRLPMYHRLDINFTYTTVSGNTWNFSLYNAYGRKNAYTLYFEENERYPTKLSLFSFVPSITYNFKF